MIVRILESVLYGEDLMASYAFYVVFLGLEVISFDPERDLFLRCEDSVLILFKASKTLIPDAGVPAHGATGPGHLAFRASRNEMAAWKDRLLANGIPLLQERRWSNGAESIYFADPAGNVLEFATPDLWGL